MRKKSISCSFCRKIATKEIVEDLEYFGPSPKAIYFCEQCYKVFSTGSILGQVQLNNKMINLILDFDDNSSVSELKKKLADYSPSNKDRLYLNKPADIMSPKDFYEFLSHYVIGQNQAKIKLSLAAYEHLKNLKVGNEKQNILLLGPSGSGKTLIVNTLSKCMDLPYVLSDATSYSPTGFQGADSDSVIHDLYNKADGDIYEAEKGIVFIDEIDKLSSHNHAGTKLEGFNMATQSTLLKLMEGKRVRIPNSILQDALPPRYVETNKIMFCFGGAFNGLEQIVAKKMGHKDRLIGFRNNTAEDYSEMMKTFEVYSKASQEIMVESLIEYGLATELVGRIQTIAPLAPLSKEQLLDCLYTLDDSPLKRNKILFSQSGLQLDFDEKYLEGVAEKAMKTGTGTRALNSIIKSSISVAAFEHLGVVNTNKRIVITEECLSDPSQYTTM